MLQALQVRDEGGGGGKLIHVPRPVPEFIDPRISEKKPKRSYSVIENERFGLVFTKTGSIISGTGRKNF